MSYVITDLLNISDFFVYSMLVFIIYKGSLSLQPQAANCRASTDITAR